MSGFLELLRHNTSVLGRLVTTAALVVLAFLVAAVTGWLVSRRADDPYTRYYLRKAIHALVVVVLLVALAVVWRPFAGRIGVVLGFATAGLAFAMQEVIGALAGWVSILTGRHDRHVGDPLQRDRRDIGSVGVEVIRRVEVGAGVGHHGDTSDVERDAAGEPSRRLLAVEVGGDLRCWESGIGDHAGDDRV